MQYAPVGGNHCLANSPRVKRAFRPRDCFSPTRTPPKAQSIQPSVIPLSILDLSPIPQGATASDALRNSLDLAQHAESWGYNRHWLAEHHNMPGIASAATAVVIGDIAGGTKTIRVGSGCIMLPNHSPVVIAEPSGT